MFGVLCFMFTIFLELIVGMRSVCAWCGALLREGAPGAQVTHGICGECAARFTREEREPLQEFLDRLEAPVLVVESDGKVLTANRAAQVATKRSLEHLRGYWGGDVMECAWARLPGGCGRTEHCKACAIRNTVMATHANGESRNHIKAYQTLQTKTGPVNMRIFISTEKVGEMVLLRIDEMVPT